MLLQRNKSHLKRLIMDEGLDIVQINIDGYDIENKNKLVYEYEIKGKDEDALYNGLVKIVYINISKLKNMEYNKNEIKDLNKFEKICSLFCIRKRDILEELVKGDEELMELKENIEDITSDIDYYDRYTKSEIYGMIEREEGIEEGLIEGEKKGKEKEKLSIAKNLLKNNVSIEIISSSTGLSIETIQNLKNTPS